MSLDDDFAVFWSRFPRHVGKLAARQAYAKARQLASADAILEGIERYKRAKPAYADWCHPRTFLAQGRWLDEPDQDTHGGWRCPHDPRCGTAYACDIKRRIEIGRS
jgi:hypothetical protein